MSETGYRVTFHDSSESDENEYVTSVVPLASNEPTQPRESAAVQQQQQQPSWLRRALGGAFTMVTGAGFASNEPLAPSRNSPGDSSNSSDWQYRADREVERAADVPSETLMSVDPSEDVAIDLREVIQQYKRTPNDVYMRIILVALSISDVTIDGELLRAAAGHAGLIEVLLQSGKVNVEDPVAQEIIQEEIDAALIGDSAYDGRIAPSKVSYVKMLARVPSVKLTREQVQLCSHSGFEFIAMLYESPHLRRDIPPPRWIVARTLDLFCVLEVFLRWMSLVAVLLNIVCIGWMANYWFTSANHGTFGYFTIVCYVVGYVVSIVVTMTSEESRLRNYEHHIWNYPDSTLKVMPVIPLFDIALMYVSLRYLFVKDREKYFVIRYDLNNGLSNNFICNTLFFAMPQLLLQFYLFQVYAREDDEFTGFVLLSVVSYTSYGMMMYLFVRKILYNHSCNCFGFAVLSSQEAPTRSVDITLRFLIVMILLYMECNVITVTFSILGIGSCSWSTTVFISVIAGLTALLLICFLLGLIFERPELTVILIFPILAAQLAFSIYVTAKVRADGENAVCTLYALTATVITNYVYVTFGFMCIGFLAWLALAIFRSLTGRHIYPYWDHYFPELGR